MSEKKMLSVLQTYNVETGERKVLRKFDEHIEAPNWSKDGTYLIYNSEGGIHRYDLKTGDSLHIYSGVCTRCNNDHVLSPDGKWIGISAGTAEDGWSKVWTMPIEGGAPKQITPLKPSYLHGISPDGKTLVVSNRGDDSLALFEAEGGKLTLKQIVKVGGKTPREFAYTPDGKMVFCCNQDSSDITVLKVNADGTLTLTDKRFELPRPVSLIWKN